MKTVCVYCGSSSDVDEKFKTAARDMGTILAGNGMALVYGGGDVGLMGIVADAVLQGGQSVIGIIPEFITKWEVQHTGLTELHVVDTMHERKMMMAEKSDGFVILPGGFGTLDEFFEILTWRQLGIHKKPIVLVNIEGYWDALLSMVHTVVGNGFAHESHKGHFTVAETVEQVVPLLKTFADENGKVYHEKI